ncbi:MAG: SBBP repeat-containing protein [Planctomycetota bacterium]|jgi:hypothetical protein
MLTNAKTKSIAIVILCLSTVSFGAEPVSISHSITSCTVDGPTATINLALEIVNNTTTVLSGAEITTSPMGPLEKRLGLIFEQAAMQVGDIPAEGIISVDYTIESINVLAEGEIGHLPVFWEVGYIDETGQQRMIVVRSEAPFSEPQVTTETTSAAVASLSSFGVIEEWVARYNGQSNSYDEANAMAVDASGNVYVTGGSVGGSYGDYATVKYDSAGNELWVARYNGPGNSSDGARAIALDTSGNVYVTGQSHGGSTYSDYATIKYDPNGNEQWVARYDSPVNDYDSAYAMAVDASGNVYVTGRSYGISGYWISDYATIKYDSSGNELWVARYKGPADYHDNAEDIDVDAEGNVYVTGGSYGSGTYYDYATIKYDPNGNELWVARYNGPGNYYDNSKDIDVDGSGNVYVTGWSKGSGTYYDYATIKYDPNGNEQWVARYDGPANLGDHANAMALDASGNVYVTGRTYHDYATVKYDSSGEELWVRTYDGPANGSDGAYAMALDRSGNVYVAGYSYSRGRGDYATIKYDSWGNELWVARYNGPGNSDDFARAMALDGSGNVYVTGVSDGSGTKSDYATVKYSQEPAKVTEALIAAVISLNLQQGISNSLDSKLGAALNVLDDINTNNDLAAVNTLEAFINAVEAQRGGWIPELDANGLIQAAKNIVNMLSGL